MVDTIRIEDDKTEQVKPGDFVSFYGMGMRIYGHVCGIEDGETGDVLYVRESLTRWCASKNMVMQRHDITKENFYSRVKHNADISGITIPNDEQIDKVLKLYCEDFHMKDRSEIFKILKIES